MMSRESVWLFTQVRLGEIVGGNRSKATEPGCCKRTRKLRTILDYDAASRWVWQAVNKLTVFLAHWIFKLLSLITFGNLPPLVGVAAVVERDGKILMIVRNDGLGLSLPGGIIKWNETAEEALRREVLEETGYGVSVNTRP